MLPHFIQPMLAGCAAEPFNSRDHLFELKWDGIRCLAFVGHKGVRLQSRKLLDLTAQFPELSSLNELPSGTVLDGELVVLKEGRPSLSSILQRVQLGNRERRQWLSRSLPATYVAFDLLHTQGHPLLHEPLIDRRAQLEKLFQTEQLQNVCASEAIRERGRELFASASKFELEGIMAKYLFSPYLPGQRSCNWLKIKPHRN